MALINVPDVVRNAVVWVAASAITGVGASALGTARTVALQGQQIATMEQHELDLAGQLKQLNSDVQQLNVNVAVLNQRLADGKR